MLCELCGKKDAIYDCEIEGTSMKVCQDCSRFGKVSGRSNVRVVVKDSRRQDIAEPEYVFLQGFGSTVKNARERLGLKPEDFAKKINERESVIHQVESEHMKPSIALAKKLERFLNITIVEEAKSENAAEIKKRIPARDEGLSLGDFIKKR